MSNQANLQIGIKLTIDNIKSQISTIEKQIKEKIKLGVELDSGNITERVKQSTKKIQQQLNQTPLQLKINNVTGVNNINKITNEQKAIYRQMFKEIVNEHDKMQSAISASANRNIKRREQEAKAQGNAINRNAQLQRESDIQMENAFIATERRKREEIEKSARLQAQAINRNLENAYRNQPTQGTRVTDVNRAYVEANRINNALDRSRQARQRQEQSYEQWWQRSLQTREQREIQVAQRTAQSYEGFWQRALQNREQAENRLSQRQAQTETNRINRLNSGGQSSRVRIYDDLQRESTQTSMTNRLSGLQERINTVTRNSSVADRGQLSAINAEYARLESTISRISNNRMAQRWSSDYTRLNTQVRQMNQTMQEGSRGLGGYIQNMGMLIKKFSDWLIVGNLLMSTIREFREGIQFINELNTAQTNIAMITGASRENIQGMTKDYAELARSLHDTTSSVMKASEEFLRAGHSHEETMQLIKASTLMSKISGQDQKQSADQLIAITNAYKLNIDQVMDVVDKLTTVDNASATSTAELGTAIERTAASAQMAGVDFKDLVSYIATVSSVTRKSASSIGESYKTIFSRYQDVKGGKNFDYENEDISNVERDMSRYTKRVVPDGGIHIRKTSGEFKDFSAVINELSNNWDKLNQAEQSGIAKALAGTRQRENFLVLMDNFNKTLELQQKQLNSTGSAMERYEKFTESTQAKLNDLTNAIQQSWMKALNSDVINGFIQGLTTLVSAFGNVETVVLLVANALFLFAGKAITNAIVGVGSYIGSLVSLIATEGMAEVATMELSLAFNALKTAFMTNPLGIIIAGFSALAGIIMFTNEKQRQHNEETIKSLNTTEEHRQKIASLTKQYEDLSKNVNTDKDAKSKLIGVEQQLKEAIGKGSEALFAQNSTIDENIAKIGQLTKAQIQQQLTLKQLDYTQAKKYLSGEDNNGIFTPSSDRGKTPQQLKEKYMQELERDNKISNPNIFTQWGINSTKKSVEELDKNISDKTKIVEEYEALQKALNKPLELPPPKVTTNVNTNKYTDDPSYIPPNDSSKTSSISAEKDIAEKTLLKDRYAIINIEIQKYNNLIEENKALQEDASLTDEQKNKLLADQINNYKLLQDAVHRKAEATRDERDNLITTMGRQGFQFDGTGDNANISNSESVLQSKLDQVNAHRGDKNKTYYNEIKAEYDDMVESFTRFYDIQSKDIPALQRDWLGYKKEIGETKGAIDKNKVDDFFKVQSESIDKYQKELNNKQAEAELIPDNQSSKQLANLEQQNALKLKMQDEYEQQVKDLGVKWWEVNSQEQKDRLHEQAEKLRNSEIPNLIKDINKDDQLKIKLKIEASTEEFKQFNDKLDSSLKLVQSNFEKIGENDFASKLSNINQQTEITKQQTDNYKKSLDVLLSITDKNVIGTDEYRIAVDNAKLALSEGNNKLLEFLKTSQGISLDKATKQVEKFDQALERLSAKTEGLKEQRDLLDTFTPNNYSAKNTLSNDIISSTQNEISQLKSMEQDYLTGRETARKNGDVELWKFYEQKLEDAYSKERSLISNNAKERKQLLQDQFNEQNKSLEKVLFNGSTASAEKDKLDALKKSQSDYISGDEKNFELSQMQLNLDLWNKELQNTKIDQFDEQIKQMTTMNQISRDDLDLLQKQINIKQAQAELDFIQSQKNTRVLRQDENGKYSWHMEADYKAVVAAQIKVASATADFDKTQKQINIKKQEDLINSKEEFMSQVAEIQQKALNGEYKSQDEFNNSMSKLYSQQNIKYAQMWQGIQSTQLLSNTSLSGIWSTMSTAYGGFTKDMSGFSTQLSDAIAKNAKTTMDAVQSLADALIKLQQIQASSGISSSTVVNNKTLPYLNSSNRYDFTKTSQKNGQTNSLTSFIDLLQFEEGGYTGSDEGVAYLHKKERVLTATQTESFEKLITNLPKITNIMDGVINRIKIPSAPMLVNNNKPTTTPIINYNFDVGSIQTNDVSDFIRKMKQKIRSS